MTAFFKSALLATLLVPANIALADGPTWTHDRLPEPEVQVAEPAADSELFMIERWGSDTCGAEPYFALGGQYRTVILATLGLPGRVFTPDHMVGSTDYLLTRINFHFDADDRLVRVGCG